MTGYRCHGPLEGRSDADPTDGGEGAEAAEEAGLGAVA